MSVRVYYRVGQTKTFPNANCWRVDNHLGVEVQREEPGAEEGETDIALIAYVAPGVWETVVDADLQDEPFPAPPRAASKSAGVVIP